MTLGSRLFSTKFHQINLLTKQNYHRVSSIISGDLESKLVKYENSFTPHPNSLKTFLSIQEDKVSVYNLGKK